MQGFYKINAGYKGHGKQMKKNDSLVESGKMHTEKYKGNTLQFYLPMNAWSNSIEIGISPTKCTWSKIQS